MKARDIRGRRENQLNVSKRDRSTSPRRHHHRDDDDEEDNVDENAGGTHGDET